MEWQGILNIAAGAALSVTGWFLRQLWDSVQTLKDDIKDIEIDLPSHYVRKDEIKASFDKIEVMLEKINDKLDRKVDKE